MDLQRALVERAQEVGVEIVLGARVVGVGSVEVVDEEDGDGEREGEGKEGIEEGGRNGIRTLAQVRTDDGRIWEVDFLVGADGLWSTCRNFLLNRVDAPLPTGDLAYRIVLREEAITDQAVRQMVKEPGVRFWIGPDAHVVAYSLRGGTEYNVVLLVPDDLGEGVRRVEGSVEEMRGRFEGWDPVYVSPTCFLSTVFSFLVVRSRHADTLQTHTTPLLRLQSRQMETPPPPPAPLMVQPLLHPPPPRRRLPPHAPLPRPRRQLLHRRRRRPRPASLPFKLHL